MPNHAIYYARLGLEEGASKESIQTRYRFLCHAYHPDKFTSAAHKIEAEKEFRAINEAYEILIGKSETSSSGDGKASRSGRGSRIFSHSLEDLRQLEDEYYSDDEISLSDWLQVHVGVATCERLEEIMKLLANREK